MVSMTEQELNAYMARTKKQPSSGPGVDKESKLHAEILAHCKRMGWIALHGSMANSTFRTPGEWDFTLLLDRGRVLFIECKTKTGKLSPEQQAIHAWADRLNHRVFTVRSFEQFIEITKSI